MGVTVVISRLDFAETIPIDHDRLGNLLRDFGAAGAERVVDRAVDEISSRLLIVESAWASGEFKRLAKTAQSLIPIADQVGMHLLSHVACDVASLSGTGDAPALAASVARLQRVGEGSLLAMWSGQQFSI